MNTILKDIRIDEKHLTILSYLATHFESVYTVDAICKEMDRPGWKTNYATVYRKVASLKKQGFITAEKYGMANQIQINLNNDATLLLLSMVEVLRRQSFQSSIRQSFSSALDKLAAQLAEFPHLRTVAIFGSYATDKARNDSDMDFLVITSERSDSRSEIMRNSLVNIFRTAEFRSDITINPIIVSEEEFAEMMAADGNNVGKETHLCHIITFGESNYWKLVLRCYQKRSFRKSMINMKGNLL